MPLARHEKGWTLRVRVQPRASRDEIAEVAGDALRVRLTAPPVEGKANKALVRFLASALGLRPRQVTLLRGDAARDKIVLLEGDEASIRSRLTAAVAAAARR